MKIKHLLSISLGLYLFSGTFAQAASNYLTWFLDQTPELFMMGSMGPTWGNGGRSQTFYLTSDIEKTYENTTPRHLFDAGEFYIGLQKRLPFCLNGYPQAPIYGAFGIAARSTFDMVIRGNIWEDADPDFNNFYYQYRIEHTDIALKARLFTEINAWLPFVQGGVGLGYNLSRQFTVIPKLYEEIPQPPFANKSKQTFSYHVGAGLQRKIDDHWQIGLGYEFADWGKSALGFAAEQTTKEHISLSHLYTHGLQFNLLYLWA